MGEVKSPPTAASSLVVGLPRATLQAICVWTTYGPVGVGWWYVEGQGSPGLCYLSPTPDIQTTKSDSSQALGTSPGQFLPTVKEWSPRGV